MTDDHDHGVDFGDLKADLAEESYPLPKAELLERYGDRPIGEESGVETVRELLEPLGQDEFEGPDEIHELLLSMVDESAVGRKEYSDRGTSADQDEQESL